VTIGAHAASGWSDSFVAASGRDAVAPHRARWTILLVEIMR
jgi:hypothetical protein